MSDLFPPILLALAAFGLVGGLALIAWAARAATDTPARYVRRIVGAMLLGASLFLGGFTLAVHTQS